MNEKKGWGWMFLAMITCPCHAILIIPLLAGTAFATYITEYKTATFIVLALTFTLSIYMAWKRMYQEDKSDF